MKLSIGIEFMRRTMSPGVCRPVETCMQMCADAGFNCIDFGFTLGPEENYIFRDDWRQKTDEYKNAAEKLGLVIDQTHAPFRIKKYEPALYHEIMRRSFEASAIFGAKTIVVHGDVYDKGAGPYDPEAALKVIGQYYEPYVAYGTEHGLTVCFENLFDAPQPRYRFSSRMEEVKALLDYYHHPLVGACWDLGHGRVEYGDDQVEAVRLLGDKVRALHVHDNYFGRDLHLCPLMGQMNWKDIMAYLRTSGYCGAFTLELIYGAMPDHIMREYLTLCNHIARTLTQDI